MGSAFVHRPPSAHTCKFRHQRTARKRLLEVDRKSKEIKGDPPGNTHVVVKFWVKLLEILAHEQCLELFDVAVVNAFCAEP